MKDGEPVLRRAHENRYQVIVVVVVETDLYRDLCFRHVSLLPTKLTKVTRTAELPLA